MKKINCLLALLLVFSLALSSCNSPDGSGDNGDGNGPIQALPLPEETFKVAHRGGVLGSIIQTGDGNAYVNGIVSLIETRRARSGAYQSGASESSGENKHLVTLEHNFGDSCCVSGYIGNSLYIIQDFGSLMENKKGVGHKDGTVILEYGENGYYSISSFSENKIIVGNPDPSNTTDDWSDSFTFGYMTYDPVTKELVPMFAENNLRFYTAGYFIGGVALVSVKENDSILFGVIDTDGNYVVEPQYEMMADEMSDGLVIVALETEAFGFSEDFADACGKHVLYDSTLMTEVQKARIYERKSSTVGLLDATTGQSVLPCSYSFISRVMENTYFVKDNDGNAFLYYTKTNSFTKVETGNYSYFNSEWMLYTVSGTEGYLADAQLGLYELEDECFADIITRNNFLASLCINTNVISAVCDDEVKRAVAGRLSIANHGIEGDYDMDLGLYPYITVTETGSVIENVNSYTLIFNGGFLYTVENSLYRYDMKTGSSVLIETGFGNFTEDYNNLNVRYRATIGEIDLGVYALYYEALNDDGSRSSFMIIVNDMGVVLFDTSINGINVLEKNYLGKYDDALYEIAGGTEIEDNYNLTMDDGQRIVIQFVRGEAEDGSSDSESDFVHVRTFGDLWSLEFISPFMLDFKDGSEITVEICGYVIPEEYYDYKADRQSLKIKAQIIDYKSEIFEVLSTDRSLEISVSAGEESLTLWIKVSPYAFRF